MSNNQQAVDSFQLIRQRVSTALLQAPAPSQMQIEQLIQAAICAPDHHSLRPWQFIQVQDDARLALAQMMVDAAKQEQPDPDDALLARLHGHPLRAPLILIASIPHQTHPKVPAVEQVLSMGAAVQNILLMVEAMGFAAIWRTGFITQSPLLKQSLGLDKQDEIAGFIYIGTAVNEKRQREGLLVSDYLRLL